MKKILFLFFISTLFCSHAWAKHEKGGYVSYQYMGKAADTTQSIYKITVTMFYHCTVTGPYNISLNVYDTKTGNVVYPITLTPDSKQYVNKTTYSPCLSNPPAICYLVDVYTTLVTLPNIANGYTIGVVSSGHRTGGIDNIYDAGCTDCNNRTQTCYSSCATGLAMTAQIPGIINGVDYHTNSTPTFIFKDTAVICHGQYFEYQFEGIDVDKDSLSYSFGYAEDGANTTAPPFASVIYAAGYSSESPLGSGVTINPATGLISGIAPTTTGEFIVDVFVKEWRNGVLLDSIKKELQISVNNCSLLSADLKQVYVNCDSLTLSFQNESSASNITTYLWNFGDTGTANNTGTTPIATHTYSKAGDYTLSLYVANNDGCNNTATAKVKVYPGFTPSFKTIGSCYQSPITFINTTYAKYGTVNSWAWNFGDPTSTTNTANTDTASHLYGKPQTATVIMNVGSTVGCFGSDTMQVVVNDKPYINLIPYPDTVICDKDSLKLTAQTTATTFSWSPQTNMIDFTTLTPTVFPKIHTTYTITVQQGGCVGSASVLVNSVKFITVSFNPDTVHACKTDSIILNPNTIAFTFLWTETGSTKTLGNDTIKNPKASPHDDITTYHVSANLGRCPANASVTVYASPKPIATITSPVSGTTICYGDSTLLQATITGDKATWSHAAGLSNSANTSTIAKPTATTNYILTVTDNGYCHKLVSDNVLINVVPLFAVTAGDDTAVILGEQLGINAYITDTTFKYPVTYKWTPIQFIDYIDSPNITITGLPPAPDFIKYTVIATTKEGCTDSAHLTVKFFNTKPDIFVPTAFAPYGSVGANKILIPIPVGIAHFEYFRIYDRFGHLVYSTNQTGTGWDGTINGTMSNAGTYVYVARGIDYLHFPVNKKGTVVLIR